MSFWLQTVKNGGKQTGLRAAAAHNSHLLRWIASFGGLGIFAVSVVDSSVVPLPVPGSTDLLLLLLSAQRGTSAIAVGWLALCAIGGSVLGAYLTWSAGRKGGEVALERYIPKRLSGRITQWVEKRGAWSVGVSALMPPPVPLMPFLLAAGALNVPRGRFLVFFGTARTIRYSLLAWLGLTYGHHIVRTWLKSLDSWSSKILWFYCGLVALGIVFGLWKFMRSRQVGSSTPNTPDDVLQAGHRQSIGS